MLKLWYAPQTRSARILWLLEELGLPYALERIEFAPTQSTFFQQQTPTGKLPTLQDGDVLMCESGAIIASADASVSSSLVSVPVIAGTRSLSAAAAIPSTELIVSARLAKTRFRFSPIDSIGSWSTRSTMRATRVVIASSPPVEVGRIG